MRMYSVNRYCGGGGVNVSFHSCDMSSVGNLEESALPLDSLQTQAAVQLLLIRSRFLQLLAPTFTVSVLKPGPDR